MRRDRTGWRIAKAALLFGAVGLLAEGGFELHRLAGPFLAPPSVPGQSKIIEHFAIQHLLFPLLGVLLVVAPLRLTRLFASRLAAVLIGTLAVLVTIPELLVSRTDLFRPYPFALHLPWLTAWQMAGGVNLWQAQHLLFAHLALMGAIAFAALVGQPFLARMAGPRTGGR